MTTKVTQKQKGEAFRKLHEAGCFLIPNPWDAGSARMLENLGFSSLATTSGGFAFGAGHADGTMTREETLGHMKAVSDATDIPVSADYTNAFAETLDEVAESFRLAALSGVVGASIEDWAFGADGPYEIARAADRVRAAVEAVRKLDFKFTLTARAENFIIGRRDLKDTVARLQAYQEAGADVLYAPGLLTEEEITTVVRSVDRPVNVIAGIARMDFTMADFARMGVRRVSIGSGVARAAYTAFLAGAREMRDKGSFTYTKSTLSMKEITAAIVEKSS
jgi:2-methylisocitrate lyase-like PEP mutase family enzyme